MKKLAQLKKQLADLKAQGLSIVEAAETGDREMSDDEATKFAAIEAQISETKEAIAAEERLAEARRSMEAISVPGAGQNTVRDTDPNLTAGFKDMGEFVMAVRGAVNASHVGGAIDGRLLGLTGTHQGGGDAGEGYSLPPQFRADVYELVTDFDEFGPLIDEEPTSAREVKMGVDETTPWGGTGVKAYWRREGGQMSPSQLADEGRSVPLHELYTFVLATEELLADAPRLNNRITRKAAEAIAWKKNLAIVEGTGVGQPLGWMKSGAKLAVAKESGQAANTIVVNNVVKMYSRLRMMRGSSPFWLANQNTLPQLMTMTIGDQPVWIPPTGVATAPGGYLMGLPVRWSEFSETLGTEGDLQLVQPKGYYGARRSAGVDFASSIHLYFDYNIQAFRWVFRYGGQPHLSAPVEAAKGDSKSDFITLATRA